MILENVRNMVRVDSHRIEMIVKFSHIAEEINFLADENDIEEHGRELYQRANNGEFGPIGE